MRILRFGVVGVLVQAAALAAFILVSRSSWARTGKPLVMSLAVLAIGLVLWREIRCSSGIASLFWLPVVLSFGWLLAVEALGAVAFPGLLTDSHWDIDYLFDSVRILVDLTIVYGIATIALFVLHRGMRRWHRERTRPIVKPS